MATVALVLVFPKFSRTIVEKAFDNFWKSVGIGFIGFVVTPAAAIVLAVTIVGLMAALVVGMIYALILLISSLYAGVILGSWIAHRFKKEYVVSWKWAGLGSILVFLISLVPLVGWVATFILFLAALGALGRVLYRKAFGEA